MCGQAVCMHGTVPRGTWGRSPLPSATHILRARSAKSSPLQRTQRTNACRDLAGRSACHRPHHEPGFMNQLRFPGWTEDGQPAVRPQGRLPVPLPLHVGSEEVEFGQSAVARVANGLAGELLARRELVERLVVTELYEVMLRVVHHGKVGRDADALVLEEPERQRAALGRVARDLCVEANQLGPLRDGGAIPSLPARGLDGEEVRERDVERLGVLAVQEHVPGLALLRAPPLAAAEVPAGLGIEARLDQVVAAVVRLGALLFLCIVRS